MTDTLVMFGTFILSICLDNKYSIVIVQGKCRVLNKPQLSDPHDNSMKSFLFHFLEEKTEVQFKC